MPRKTGSPESPEPSSKPDLMELVSHWLARTGYSHSEIASKMTEYGFKTTTGRLKAKFLEHPDRISKYDPYQILALVKAFYVGVPNKRAARAFETLLAFRWSGLVIDKAILKDHLINIFGETETELAMRKFEIYVHRDDYSFADYFRHMHEIIGRTPVPKQGYSLKTHFDSELGKQIEEAKKLHWEGDTEQARRLLAKLEQEALAQERRGRPTPELSEIYHQHGIILTNAGCYEEARQKLRQALKYADQSDDLTQLAKIYANLAVNAYYQADYPEAKAAYKYALENAESAGLLPVILFAETGLANIDMEEQRYDQALERLEGVYLAAVEADMKDRVIYTVLNISYIHMLLENDEKAEEYLNKGFEHISSITHPQLLAQLHLQKGRLMMTRRHYYEYEAELITAFNIAKDIKNIWLLQMVQIELAKSHLAAHNNDKAELLFHHLLIEAIASRNKELAVKALYGLVFIVHARQSADGTLPISKDVQKCKLLLKNNVSQRLKEMELTHNELDQTRRYFAQGLDNYTDALKQVANQVTQEILNL